LQLRVLRFGVLQDGDVGVGVGVGVFPEREEVSVSGERPDAGGIGIRSSQKELSRKQDRTPIEFGLKVQLSEREVKRSGGLDGA